MSYSRGIRHSTSKRKQKYDNQSQLDTEADLAAQESQVGKADTPSNKNDMGGECLNDSEEDDEPAGESNLATLSSDRIKLLEKCGTYSEGKVDDMKAVVFAAEDALWLADKNPVPEDAVGTDKLAISIYTQNLDHRVQVAIMWVGEAYEQEAHKAAHPMLAWQDMMGDDDLIADVLRYN